MTLHRGGSVRRRTQDMLEGWKRIVDIKSKERLPDYYVDNIGGSDANDGKSPATAWQTIAKVTSTAIPPGKMVGFKRGGVWRELFTQNVSGLAGNPITYGAYGTGPKPVFNGANVYTTAAYRWVLSGAGTNEYYLQTSAGGNPGITEPEHVWIDGWRLIKGTLGALEYDQYGWGNNDGLGYNTLYVKDTNGDPDVTGEVIEASRRNYCIQGTQSYLTFENIELTKCGYHTVYMWGGTDITFDHVKFQKARAFFNIIGATNLTWYYCSMLDAHKADNRLDTVGGIFTLKNCLFSRNIQAGHITIAHAATVTMDTCAFSGAVYNNIVISAGAGGTTVDINNCQLGAIHQYSSYVVDNLGGGVCTMRNSNCMWNAAFLDMMNRNVTDGGGNTYGLDPHFPTTPYKAIIHIMCDNSEGDQPTLLADTAAFNARGIYVNCVYDTEATLSVNWVNAQALLDAGNEIDAHSRGHADLRVATTQPFTVRYDGACVTATISIDVAAHSLITKINGVNDIVLDLSDPLYLRVNHIKNKINTYPNYVCAWGPNGSVDSDCRYYDFADITDVDIKAVTTSIWFNAARTYAEEIVGPKTDIPAHLHVTGLPGTPHQSTFYGYPFNYYDTAAKAAVIAAGYVGARNAGTDGVTTPYLSRQDVFVHNGYDMAGFFTDTTPSVMKAKVTSILEFATATGRQICFYYHAATGMYGYPLANIEVIRDAILDYSGTIRVMTTREANDHMRNVLGGYLPVGVDVYGNATVFARRMPNNADFGPNYGAG